MAGRTPKAREGRAAHPTHSGPRHAPTRGSACGGGPGSPQPPPRPRALRASGTLRGSGGRARTAAGSGRGGAGSPGGEAALPAGSGDRREVAAAGTGTGGAEWSARGARPGPACSSGARRPVLVLLGRGSGPAAGLGLRLNGPGLGPEPRALRPGIAGLALCEGAARFLRGARLAGRARLVKRRGHLGRESRAGGPRCPGHRWSGQAVQVPPERRHRGCCWLLPTSAAAAGLALELAAINPGA